VGSDARRLISVAVPVPFLDLLTYAVPDSIEPPLPAVGARVLVPLGSRMVTGCVVANPASDGEDAPGTLREVIDVLDVEPFVPPHLVSLARWVAEYYAAGPGEAVALCMPPGAWVAGERTVAITDAGAERARGIAGEPASLRDEVLRALADGRAMSVRRLAGLVQRAGGRKPPIVAVTRLLEREGLAAVTQILKGRSDRHKTVGIAALTTAGHEWLEAPDAGRELGARQREALEVLRGAPEGIGVAALAEREIDLSTIKRLVRRQLVALRREPVERDPSHAVSDDVATGAASMVRPLTGAQRAALDALEHVAASGAFEVALLHGVTGSGKTELYLRLAARALGSGRGALILVPEIALTPSVAGLFRAAFGERVAIQHSGLSDGERYDQWHRIRRGDVALVIGTRSAIFAPLAGCGLIVVDEEHDGSYKQDETPRYNARDVAVVRGKREDALVVLGSATPSMESFQNALAGRYRLVSLPGRVLERPLADVRLVDMRPEYAAHGPDVIVSGALKDAIDARLRAREQALVLLNRRGLATAVFCRQCGATLECPNCSVSLIVHRGKAVAGVIARTARTPATSLRARCHYCNYSRIVPPKCDHCAGPYLEHAGFGTARVEEELRTLFPGARIARVDRDTIRRRGAIVSFLDRFGRREIDVLVGTQMIAKGHDFPRVTLVGVVSADVGLAVADFRAAERTFQLLTQVAGRAGRGDQRGEAIVQTLYPEHYSIQLACRQDYRAFFDAELTFRRAMRYPPVVSLINTIVRAPTFSRALQDAEDIAADLRRDGQGRFRVLGPAPAPLGRLRGEYRVQFFLKGMARTDMRRALLAALARRPDLRRRVSVDVDPISVL
jgi:primosomal protein N' (replication factor Y) (superfamily II helicase)